MKLRSKELTCDGLAMFVTCFGAGLIADLMAPLKIGWLFSDVILWVFFYGMYFFLLRPRILSWLRRGHN
jgi:hypothetical protein